MSVRVKSLGLRPHAKTRSRKKDRLHRADSPNEEQSRPCRRRPLAHFACYLFPSCRCQSAYARQGNNIILKHGEYWSCGCSMNRPTMHDPLSADLLSRRLFGSKVFGRYRVERASLANLARVGSASETTDRKWGDRSEGRKFDGTLLRGTTARIPLGCRWRASPVFDDTRWGSTRSLSSTQRFATVGYRSSPDDAKSENALELESRSADLIHQIGTDRPYVQSWRGCVDSTARPCLRRNVHE